MYIPEECKALPKNVSRVSDVSSNVGVFKRVCNYRRVNIALIPSTSLRKGPLSLSPTYKQQEKRDRKSLGHNLRLHWDLNTNRFL